MGNTSDGGNINNLHGIKHLHEIVQMVSDVLHLMTEKEQSIPAGGAQQGNGGKDKTNDK